MGAVKNAFLGQTANGCFEVTQDEMVKFLFHSEEGLEERTSSTENGAPLKCAGWRLNGTSFGPWGLDLNPPKFPYPEFTIENNFFIASAAS